MKQGWQIAGSRFAICLKLVVTAALVQPALSTAQDPPVDARSVVASVNGANIMMAEVDQILSGLPSSAELPEVSVAAQRARALEVAIRRVLVVQYLKQRSLGATAEEVQLRLDRWRQRLNEMGSNEQDYSRETGFDVPTIRRQFAWQMGWARYRDRQLTETNLQEFFAKHRREFDGTRLKLAHLLLQPTDEANPDHVWDRAAELRAEIMSGQLSFEDAVRLHSAGATAESGGYLGWITARGPMPRAFTEAALNLEPNELSPPTRSAFGVHLIRCLELEPGQQTFADVRPAVRQAAEVYLFNKLAKRQAKAAKIERF